MDCSSYVDKCLPTVRETARRRSGWKTLGLIGSPLAVMFMRQRWLPSGLSISPFERSRWRLRRTRELWEKLPVFAFCLARSLMVSVWLRWAFGEFTSTAGVGKKVCEVRR